MHPWSKFLTIAAGVLASVSCYAALARLAGAAGLVESNASLIAVDMASANVGAVTAALVVAVWPSDANRPVAEPLATWAAATVVLMAMIAPEVAQLQAAMAQRP